MRKLTLNNYNAYGKTLPKFAQAAIGNPYIKKNYDKLGITTLTGGLRQAWYKWKHGAEYFTTHESYLYLMFGKLAHSYFENGARVANESEDRYIIEDENLKPWEEGPISGVIDLGDDVKMYYRPDIYDKIDNILYDLKTMSSYKYKQLFVQDKVPFDALIQLNFYRHILQKYRNIDVRKMELFVIPMVHNVYTKQDGYIPDEVSPTYKQFTRAHLCMDTSECPALDDDFVVDWVKDRFVVLNKHIKEDTVPAPCEDTWGGLKCKRYCPCTHCEYYNNPAIQEAGDL